MADKLYFRVKDWSRLDQDTVGCQLVRSTDSISANLVEGDARGSTKDTVRFFYYSRGLAREARHWVRRAQARQLIASDDAKEAIQELTEIAKMLNAIIRHRRDGAQRVNEERTPYGITPIDPLTEDLA